MEIVTKFSDIMEFYWGIITIAIGLFLLVCNLTKSDFILYRLFVYRSKMLWGDNVYGFLTVVGVIIVVLGILSTAGVIW